jgi:hypothetical protein
LPSTGGKIILREGIYYVKTSISITKPVVFEGMGIAPTIINIEAGLKAPFNSSRVNVIFKDLTITGSLDYNDCLISSSDNAIFENCKINLAINQCTSTVYYRSLFGNINRVTLHNTSISLNFSIYPSSTSCWHIFRDTDGTMENSSITVNRNTTSSIHTIGVFYGSGATGVNRVSNSLIHMSKNNSHECINSGMTLLANNSYFYSYKFDQDEF